MCVRGVAISFIGHARINKWVSRDDPCGVRKKKKKQRKSTLRVPTMTHNSTVLTKRPLSPTPYWLRSRPQFSTSLHPRHPKSSRSLLPKAPPEPAGDQRGHGETYTGSAPAILHWESAARERHAAFNASCSRTSQLSLCADPPPARQSSAPTAACRRCRCDQDH